MIWTLWSSDSSSVRWDPQPTYLGSIGLNEDIKDLLLCQFSFPLAEGLGWLKSVYVFMWPKVSKFSVIEMRQLRSGCLILLGQLFIRLSPHKAHVYPSFSIMSWLKLQQWLVWPPWNQRKETNKTCSLLSASKYSCIHTLYLLPDSRKEVNFKKKVGLKNENLKLCHLVW